MRNVKWAAAMVAAAVAASASAAPREHRPDLADTAQGVYTGSVISDARGGGRPGVSITVTKTGPNTVQVTSDYGRLPPFTAHLAKYMSTIQMTNGAPGQVFLLELSKSPVTLGITDDDASWSGTRSGGD